MRRMFSQKQIEKLAKEVADYEIENAEINVNQLSTDSDYQGRFLQVQNDGSIIPATATILPDEVIEIEFTEDDFDEDSGYVKHIELSERKVYSIMLISEPLHNASFSIYSPNLMTIAKPYDDTIFDSFGGMENIAQDRYVSILSDCLLQLVNGCLFQVSTEE